MILNLGLDWRRGYVGLPSSNDTMAALFGNDDVIENSDSKQFADFGQAIGDCMILAAGRWIARGMVMYEQDR